MISRFVLATLASVALFTSFPVFAQEEPVNSVDSSSIPGRELRTVEEEVNSLKERVFRSKATLQLLKELVVEGSTTGAKVVVWHINELANSYSMESVQYFMDGKNIYTKVDPGGELASVKEMKVHEQRVPSGTHNLQIKMVLRGNGYGVFSYLRTYQFNVQSSYSLKVDDGQMAVVRVISDSKGTMKNFVERPSVRYEVRSDSMQQE